MGMSDCPVPDVKGGFTSHKEPVRDFHQHFEVQVWCNDVEVRPCETGKDSYQPPQWSMRKYVLPPGTLYELRYVQKRVTPWQRYGGRVFIDQGSGEPDDGDALATGSEHNHIFWFGEGANVFIDKGFYEGRSKSRGFVTCQPRMASSALDDTISTRSSRRKEADKLGFVRVEFTLANVSPGRAYAPKRPRKEAHNPELPFTADTIERDYKLSEYRYATAAGPVIPDSLDNATATLMAETCFECRIQFVHFSELNLANLSVFCCLPLSLFSESASVRHRFIYEAVLDLQKFCHVVEDDDGIANDSPVSNKLVAISDVVHQISRHASPAASYFTCCGDFKPDKCVLRGSTAIFMH